MLISLKVFILIMYLNDKVLLFSYFYDKNLKNTFLCIFTFRHPHTRACNIAMGTGIKKSIWQIFVLVDYM